MTATLCFVAEGVDATLGTQVRVGAWLEVVVVTARCARRIKVAGWTWCVVTWATVVKLTGWALTLALRTVVAARWAITKLFSALTVAWRAVTHTVTAHMAVGARGTATFTTLAATATATIATTASSFGVANALHHFTACGFGRRCHHVTAWGLAQAAPQGLATHGNGLSLFVGLRAKALNRHDRHLLFGEDFDVAHETLFVQRHQAHGFAA